MSSTKDAAELIVSAARLAVESLTNPSAVSRPPFQHFADAHAAQFYFVKQIVDLLTPHLLLLVANGGQAETVDNNAAAWKAQAMLSEHLLGAKFSHRFIVQDGDKSMPEYRFVQSLVGDVVRELANDEAEDQLRSFLSNRNQVARVSDSNLSDQPGLKKRGCARIVSHATAKNRGRRNEDRLLVSAFAADNADASFLAVLDGHGGCDGADLAAAFLLPLFLNSQIVKPSETEGDSADSELIDRLRRLFVDVDAKLGEAAAQCGAAGGCTCTVCIISGDQLTVAWAGDSEAWLIHSNGLATQLTSPPHRPNVPSERSRLESAGGFVMDGSPPRLNGVLAVTRSLGDRGVVGSTPEPDIAQRKLAVDDSNEVKDVCVVLASDGLWDAVDPNDAAAALVAMQTDSAGVVEKESKAASALIDMATAAGSTDNVTVIVAWF